MLKKYFLFQNYMKKYEKKYEEKKLKKKYEEISKTAEEIFFVPRLNE